MTNGSSSKLARRSFLSHECLGFWFWQTVSSVSSMWLPTLLKRKQWAHSVKDVTRSSYHPVWSSHYHKVQILGIWSRLGVSYFPLYPNITIRRWVAYVHMDILDGILGKNELMWDFSRTPTGFNSNSSRICLGMCSERISWWSHDGLLAASTISFLSVSCQLLSGAFGIFWTNCQLKWFGPRTW